MGKRTLFFIGMVAVITTTLIADNGYSLNIFSRYKAVTPVNGEVRLDIATVQDGKAHYFSYKDGGKVIKFFVIKSRDGVIRAAFDACDVCFSARKGYDQEQEFMVCKNCGRKFHNSRINVVEGGCNPAPLKRRLEEGELVIAVADIVPGGRFF